MEELIKKENIIMVVTINGDSVDKTKCRKILGDYYIIGDVKIKDSGDCYYINDKYYRIETNYITYDYEIKEYVVKNNCNLSKGVVEIIDGNLVYGYFTPIKFKNVYVNNDDNNIICLSEDIFKNTNIFRERLSDGIFYNINNIKAIQFNKIVKPRSSYKRSLEYNCKDIIGNYTDDYNNNNLEINSNIEKYGDVVKDLSFGLEFETTKGIIPDRLTKPLGLIPLRDGSITGIEYVTIPLSGKKGLQSVVDSCNLLKKRTDFDNNCALHLHIGGIPRTMEFILALYKTLVHIQDDVYNMFPLYKKYNFGVKQNDYTKQLPTHELISQMDKVINSENIVENFDVLFTYLSQGVEFKGNYKSLDDVDGHPSDPRGNRKWQVGTRYLWANMIPLIFDNKQTVEFRIHTPTFEANKVINYIMMCGSIINFVKYNSKRILSNSNEIFKSANLNIILERSIYSNDYINDNHKRNIYNCINGYVRNRKEVTYHQNCQGNVSGNETEISNYSSINWNKHIKKKSNETSYSVFRPQEARRIEAIVNNGIGFADFLENLHQPNNNVVLGNNDNVVIENDNVVNGW
tara:strand:+ start:2852 stop:4573 length:1722 start_codon:yes stop_codon:yes gene_type:complete